MRIKTKGLLELFCALMAAALAAEATTLVRMNLDQLTASAAVVARTRCLSAESRLERGEIWTLTQFETVEALKGTPPPQITVRLIGGRAGHLISTVDGVPRFRAGEDAILFLHPLGSGEWSVTSWTQGTFRVRRDSRTQRETVTQDTSGLAIFNPATRQFEPGGIKNLPLEEFRQRVREAVAREGLEK